MVKKQELNLGEIRATIEQAAKYHDILPPAKAGGFPR